MFSLVSLILLATFPIGAFALDPESAFFERILNFDIVDSPRIPFLKKKIIQGELELDVALSSRSTSRSEIYEKGESLVALYLDSNRVQEAIWALQSLGEWRVANILQERLESFIQTARKLDAKPIGDGINKAKLVDLGSNVFVVSKKGVSDSRGNPANSMREVVAYRLSHILGLKLVPTTIVYKNNLSRMVYIQDAKVTDIDFSPNYPKNYLAYPEIYILDYLTSNMDRHGRNSLFRLGGKMVAIDHDDVALGTYETALNALDTSVQRQLIKGKTLEQLNSVTLDDLSAALSGVASEKDIRVIYARIKRLRKHGREIQTRAGLFARLRPNKGSSMTTTEALTNFDAYSQSLTGEADPHVTLLKLEEWIDWHESKYLEPRETLNRLHAGLRFRSKALGLGVHPLLKKIKRTRLRMR